MRSFSEGWARLRSAPALLLGVYAMTVVLALPLAITMRGLLQAHLGASLAAEGAANGVNYDWWQEFTSQATGLGTTFSPTIIGFAATLDNISSLLDAQREIAPIAGALALYLLAWTFLAGGIIDRYARQRPIRAAGFFAASGVHVFRLLRLAVVSGLIYWWLFAYVHPWLFLEWFADRTRTMSVERDVFFWRVALYVLFGALLVVVNVIFDYAKIRIVVEDRRSALGALSAAIRFVWRQRGRVASLYALNGLAFLIVIAVWALVAPGARGGRAHALARVPRLAALRAGEARAEAAVPRFGDRAVPVAPRARVVRGHAGAGVARFPVRGID